MGAIKIKRAQPRIRNLDGGVITEADMVKILDENGYPTTTPKLKAGYKVILQSVRMLNGIPTRTKTTVAIVSPEGQHLIISGRYGAVVEGKFTLEQCEHVVEVKPTKFRRKIR